MFQSMIAASLSDRVIIGSSSARCARVRRSWPARRSTATRTIALITLAEG
jgi:hypothetical protein